MNSVEELSSEMGFSDIYMNYSLLSPFLSYEKEPISNLPDPSPPKSSRHYLAMYSILLI